jgi:hypothetical protein
MNSLTVLRADWHNVFDPVMADYRRILEEQFARVGAKDHNVDLVLTSGGFSENPVFQKATLDFLEDRKVEYNHISSKGNG